MKYTIKLILLIGVLLSFWNCSPNVVNLQTVDVIGSSIKNPVKIIDKKERSNIDLSFNVSINNSRELTGNIEGHTDVNENNIFELESVDGEDYFLEYSNRNNNSFSGNNFIWITPAITSQLDLDFALSNHFAITLGAKYSGYKNETFWGHSIGLAYFSKQPKWAYRFDTFIRYQEMLYDVSYIKTENISLDNNPYRKVYVYNENGKNDHFNTGFMFSVNSAKNEWPINFFANYSFGYQTLYNISPDSFYYDEKIGEFERDDYYHSFSVGVYQNTLDFGRIILGYSFINYEQGESNFILPSVFVQYDIAVF